MKCKNIVSRHPGARKFNQRMKRGGIKKVSVEELKLAMVLDATVCNYSCHIFRSCLVYNLLIVRGSKEL